MKQSFPVERESRILFTSIKGDLKVYGWDRQEISLDWDENSRTVQQEGNALMLGDCLDDVSLRVPYDAELRVESRVGGDVRVDSIRRVELHGVRGDVELKNIGIDANLENIRETVFVENVSGDLVIKRAASVRGQKKSGADVLIEDVPLIEIEQVGADLVIRQTEMASIGSVAGDMLIVGISQALRSGNIGGDAQIKNSSDAEIALGNIGGDVAVERAASLELGSVGGDAELRDIQGQMDAGNIGGDAAIATIGGNLKIGNIGGDAAIATIGGNLAIGIIGGDAKLEEVQGSIQMGNIGGDLKLEGTFSSASKTNIRIGGDADVSLPADANLTLQAVVGGTVRGSSVSFGNGGNIIKLVYGEGSAEVSLSVGGDLAVHSKTDPQVHSASMGWGGFNQDMANLSQEMAQLGTELGKMGAEFSQSMAGNMSQMGINLSNDVSQRVQEELRKARQKAEEQARRAQERAQQARQKAERVYVRVNEREWQMRPERINELIAKAQQATAEGVAGAVEAVDRAINNLRMQRQPQQPYPSQQPAPPTPPTGQRVPPMPPTPQAGDPIPPIPPIPPYPSSPSDSTPASAQGTNEPQGEPGLDQEREAILRMIAEGRITPEEGDMLLEGLGN